MKELAEFQEKFLPDYDGGHTDFQLTNFVCEVNNQTLYGQYKQCLRELHSRFIGLESLEKELVSAAQNDEWSKFAGVKMSIETLKREFRCLMDIVRDVRSNLPENYQDKKGELETEYWVHKFKMMAAIDMITQGRMSRSTAEMFLSFPLGVRSKLLKTANDKDRLLAEMIEGETNG